jgi:LruC domain-containing protein
MKISIIKPALLFFALAFFAQTAKSQVDTDIDGVPDINDDYPTDQYRAFNNAYPSAGAFGTLAFEDNWPSKGDYDFNDVVVDYNLNTVTNSQNQVVEIIATFNLRASGASYPNGFGFQLDHILPTKITTVTGVDRSPGTYVTDNSNGLEANQTFATCVVFDNFFHIMPKSSGSIGVNTEKDKPLVSTQTRTITLTFLQDGVAPAGGATLISSLPSTAFNFFIIANNNRGAEIHLPDRVPTSLVDHSLFTRDDDDSHGARIYKTQNNLPWAIDIIQGFKYPIEGASLNNAYLHLIRWAETGGVEYSDWNENKEGYRAPAQLY